MAIENTYLLGKNITLGCGFDLQAKAPLDSRQVVPTFAGLQALIDGNAAFEGLIVFDEETKKTYQAQMVDDVLKFREFGINEAELKDLIASETTAAMEFKGAATALPENPAKGDMYKVTAAFKVGEEDVKVGDSIVYDGEQWFIIPSGDDIEDTWRPVTGVDNDATLTFAAGDKLEKTVAADGTITYKHVAIDAPTNMNEEGDEQTRTYITQLITDNHGHVIGFKTATENVEDTNTTYEFEGVPVDDNGFAPSSVYFQVKSSEAESAEVVYLDTYTKNEIDAKTVGGVSATESSANEYVEGALSVDVSTGLEEDGRGVQVMVALNKGGVTTDALADKSVTNDKLSEDVQASLALADSALQAHQDISHLATKTDVANQDAVVLAEAQAYTDEKIGTIDNHSHENKAVLDGITGDKVAAWDAAEQNAKDYTDDQIEELALGTMSKETADDYVKKSDATGYGDILTKTEAQGAYQPKGDYATAAQTLKSGYNAAIINLQNGNLSAAKQCIASDMSAKADYLRAVIACKEGDINGAKAQLNSAVSKDASLKAKAEKDINLAALK